MLLGYLPYEDYSDKDDLRKLYDHISEVQPEISKDLSTEAQDLLRRILNNDPTKRCDIETIMSHRYFKTIFKIIKFIYKLLRMLIEYSFFNNSLLVKYDYKTNDNITIQKLKVITNLIDYIY